MDKPVATVNGVPIDGKALGAAMQSLAQEEFHATLAELPQTTHGELRAMALERLVARELIFQAALAAGFVANEDEVAAETSRILRQVGNPADFWQRLAERGMDEASFRRMVRKDVTVDRYTARQLESVAEPQESEIEAFYRKHPEQLRSAERVRVSHILLEAGGLTAEENLARARCLRNEAVTGDFAALARKHSDCPSAPGGGDLGFIRRGDVDPTFADAAFSQVVGEVGEPVRTPFGLHLVKVTAREIPSPPTLDEARPRIIQFLKRAAGAELLKDWVADLRQGARIEILPD